PAQVDGQLPGDGRVLRVLRVVGRGGSGGQAREEQRRTKEADGEHGDVSLPHHRWPASPSERSKSQGRAGANARRRTLPTAPTSSCFFLTIRGRKHGSGTEQGTGGGRTRRPSACAARHGMLRGTTAAKPLSRRRLAAMNSPTRKWRNWQTRRIQDATACPTVAATPAS